jgi:hypothetical protein
MTKKCLLLAYFSLLLGGVALLTPAHRAAGSPVVRFRYGTVETDTFIHLPYILNMRGLQSPVLKWAYGGCFSSWCQTGWYASPAAANLDADPQLELMAGSYDLIALDGVSGSLEWRATNNSRVWPGIALTDLTGNGTLEIIVGRGGDQLTVYNTQGEVVWSVNPFGAGEVRSLAVADLDDDGSFEILTGRASGGATEQINVFSADGSVRPGWPARRDGEAGYGWGMYNQNIAAGDLDGDGYSEVIGPTDTHYITALNRFGDQLPAHAMYNDIYPDGPKVWSQVGVHVDHEVDLRGYALCGSEHRPNFADSAPVIADLDGNGISEIIVVGNVYNCGTSPYSSLYQMPFIFNADRSRWSGSGFNWANLPLPDGLAAPISEDYNVIESALPNPSIADLDGDGYPEILFPSYDGRFHAYWLDKTQHGYWPYEVYDPAEGVLRFASEAVVADLDNDGQAEVIFTSWAQKGSYQNGKLHIVNARGKEVFEVDLPPARNGDWNGSLAAPTLANIDLDSEFELILQTAHAGVVVYDLPGSSQARLLWQTGRGGFLRNGSSD